MPRWLLPPKQHPQQQNLHLINSSVQKLTKPLQAYPGGLLAASSISSDEERLGHAIADSESVTTEEEAKNITAYIRETLEPNIAICMALLKEKEEVLVAAGLQSTVFGDMGDLRKLTEDLGKALLAKAPERELIGGEEVVDMIDGDFEDAINVFV
ncbi:hypothetical protein AC578_4457 [Pseudocercospora eumusae]|uniref:Uncharacterized protein n=1 Tax=Pseudocercospora eumusae TaxID=321146 RepID=A0A139HF07_9PEZI|nr:hypothetical protein AC578_4457 [Pseudocercospora eumusae]